ncbi:hypothetical protein K8I28_05640, partial [bacterium]|nr:hypothetical protein [bacterium]
AHDDLGHDISTDARAFYLFHSGQRAESLPYLLENAKTRIAFGDTRRGLSYAKVVFATALEVFDSNPSRMTDIVMEYENILVKHGMLVPAIEALNQVIKRFESDSFDSGSADDLLAKREKLRQLSRYPSTVKRDAYPPLILISSKRALANVKFHQGDYDGAISLLDTAESALDIMPATVETINEGGMLLKMRAKLNIVGENYTLATMQLINAIDLLKRQEDIPEVGESYRLLIISYFKLGSNDKAAEILDQYKEFMNDKVDFEEMAFFHHTEGILRARKNSNEDAVQKLKKACDLVQSHDSLSSLVPDFSLDYAIALDRAGKLEEAKEIRDQITDVIEDETSSSDRLIKQRYSLLELNTDSALDE